MSNSCASHPVGTHLKVRDYASANSLLLGSDFGWIGRCPRHSLLAQTNILKKIYNQKIRVLHVLLVLFKWEFLEPTLKQRQLFCAFARWILERSGWIFPIRIIIEIFREG